MNRFDDISVFTKYYKAFSDIPGGFDEIKPINVIIGRNNSGKSALIELIEHISAQKTPPRSQHHRNNNAEIFMRKKVGEKELRRVFKEGAGGGLLSVRDHWLYVGKQLIGSQLTLKLGKSWSFFDLEFSEPSLQYKNGVQEKIEQLNFENPFKDLSFHRLEADRDILLEQMDDGELSISPKGHGLTRSLASIIIRNKHPRSLVNNEILGDLNQIFGPDGTFTDILTQEDDNSTHEIYLHEEEKGEIALSNSGSGLKTIILVLAFFHVLPYIKDRDLSEFVFAFE
jgi:predicted ATP-dependent endonuclease of OLD family